MAKRQRHGGFTLIELVIAISLIGIALLGVTYSLQFSVRYSADPLWQSKTLSLAKAYTEEILAQSFDERSPPERLLPCSPCTSPAQLGPDNESRGQGINQFDDVDDYDGLREETHNVLGEPREGYKNYHVDIRVNYAGKELGLERDDGAKRIDLMITPPGKKTQSFVFYRGNF